MNIQITKVGSKIKVISSTSANSIYVNPVDVKFSYSPLTSTITIDMKGTIIFNNLKDIKIANVTIAGVIITNQSVFDTQLAAVFT
jgi:hypothetical protein